jgi:hypothetical protein
MYMCGVCIEMRVAVIGSVRQVTVLLRPVLRLRTPMHTVLLCGQGCKVIHNHTQLLRCCIAQSSNPPVG